MPRYRKPLFVAGGTITVLEPDLVESCVEVAVILTGPGAPGAMKSPVLEMLPADACQETEVLNAPVPCTFAAHWSVSAASAEGAAHATFTEVMVEEEFLGDDRPQALQR